MIKENKTQKRARGADLNIKKILIDLSPSLATSIGILALILIFHPHLLMLLGIITAVILIKQAYRTIKKKEAPNIKAISKRLIISWLFVSVVWLLSKGLGRYGFYGFALICLLLSMYILIKGRKQYILFKHHIEARIWGKPLKDFAKGELKNRKTKFIWRRKHET